MAFLPASPEIVSFGAFEANLRSEELRRQGSKVRVPDQSFLVLAMLLEHPGELVNREEIRKKLWPGDTFVDFDHGLNNAVNRLREALGDSADVPHFIETLPRRGYRFIGTVNGFAKQDTTDSAAPAAPEAEPRSQLTSWSSARAMRYGRFAVSAVVLAVLLIAGLRFGARWKATSEPIRSVAVLPFENLSGDPSQEYFADGVTDTLITDMAQIGSLRVISRTSSMHYKGSHEALPKIARELNVDAVVEGSVARSGNRVRITAQLVQAPSDRHLWAESYERNVSDILQLQNELATAVAQEVAVKLTPQQQNHRISQVRTVNFEAYEAYLRGRYFMDKWSDEGFEKAAEYFQQSIELDPQNALAYAELANTYANMVFRSTVPPAIGTRKAEAAARKAVELDGGSPEAHNALAGIKAYFDCDRLGAEREYQRAFELNPNSGEALSYHAFFLLVHSRPEEAIAEKKRSLLLDPISPLATTELGMFLMSAHHTEEGIQQLQKAVEMDGNLAVGHTRLGEAYQQIGRYEQATMELRKAIALDPAAPQRLEALADIYREWGKSREAHQVLVNLVQMSKHRYVPPDLIAGVYARLGDKQEALAWLEKASKDDMPDLSRSEFDSLRSQPRFRKLAERFKVAKPCGEKA